MRLSSKALLTPHTDRFFAATFGRVIPKWVHPNHLTALRLISIPYVLFYLANDRYDIGVPLFVLSAITDWLDGALARTRHKVTEWGIMYDPVADKVLILTVLVAVVFRHVNPFIAYGLIAVEVVLVSGAIIAARRGKVVPSNRWGKIKMVGEAMGLSVLLVALWAGNETGLVLANGILVLALVAAVISGFTHIK